MDFYSIEDITVKWVKARTITEEEWKYLHQTHEEQTRGRLHALSLAPSEFCRAFGREVGAHWAELIAAMLDAKSQRSECVPAINRILYS